MPVSNEILNASVLIVDDQELDVYLLKNMLAEAGYTTVASTTNPLEVGALHRQHRYDLILLDLQMPAMSGFDVLAELKEIDPRGLCVLVVSGEPAAKMRALQSGAKDFVSKPFDPIEVLTRIGNLLEIRLLYKQAERRLLHLEHHDSLTGLPNRKLFYELLGRALVQAADHHLTVAVLVLDIDRFKVINDTLGHSMGDELLRQCSNRLYDCLRFNDTIARLGGDEFGMILVTTKKKPDESGLVANKIRAALGQPFDLNGHEVMVTVSIGITLYPLDGLDVSTLVQNGDSAMYRAKEAGRNTYRFYTPQMNDRAIEKLDTESALRKALAREEFVLHYQPKVILGTGRISGVEALLRWNRPEQGLVQPLDFIPILEETGLIVAVGNWVIRTACRQIAEWQRSEVGCVCIAVNLSTRQLSHESVSAQTHRAMQLYAVDPQLLEFEVETVRAVRDHGIDATLLEFELTETLLMSHAQKSVAILQRLKQLGIRLSMDDFGTGFSSLAYLKRFPIDTLKIDRAFIRDVTANADDAAITLAIIAMAHKLKLKVVAEGVETVEQLRFLRDNHCDEAQGYHLCRPLPATDISRLLRSGCIPLPP